MDALSGSCPITRGPTVCFAIFFSDHLRKERFAATLHVTCYEMRFIANGLARTAQTNGITQKEFNNVTRSDAQSDWVESRSDIIEVSFRV